MPSSTFKKSYMARNCFTQTEILTKGFHFAVRGSVKDIEDFKTLFMEKRATEEFHESFLTGGVYDSSKDIGYANLLKVLESGDYEIREFDYDYAYRVPAEVKCCGKWLSLGSFTNTCPSCGADYNGSGSLLAPRSQWGEETGEHWSECY